MKGFLVIELMIPLIIVVIAVIVFAGPFVRFPIDVVRIEEVREVVRNIGPMESEDVMGQALDINKEIVQKQILNKLWWSKWAIPDRWDDIKKIDVRRRKYEKRAAEN